MAAFYPLIQVLAKGEAQATMPVSLTSGFPLAMPSKRGDFAAYTCCTVNCEAKFPLFSGELHCRNSEASVSRLIGKFDTTATERKWQVAFFGTSVEGGKTEVALPKESAPKAKAPLPCGVAPRHLHGHWPLGTAVVSAFYRYPAGFPSIGAALWRWLLPGSAFFSGCQSYTWQPVTSLAPS